MIWLRLVILLPFISPIVGCAPPRASEGGFDSDDPASTLYAIARAGRASDWTAVNHLVEKLDSDDPVVRMMAAQALRRITGMQMGYDPYGSILDQKQAIQAWVEAVQAPRPRQQPQTTNSAPVVY